MVLETVLRVLFSNEGTMFLFKNKGTAQSNTEVIFNRGCYSKIIIPRKTNCWQVLILFIIESLHKLLVTVSMLLFQNAKQNGTM